MSAAGMTRIDSDRGEGIYVGSAADYWGQYGRPAIDPAQDLVRVDSPGFDAVLEISPTEARNLAAALLRAATQLETNTTDTEGSTR